MRDYKNVKVPRKYRTGSRTTTVNKRTVAGPVKRRKRAGRLKNVLSLVLGSAIAVVICYGAWTGYKWLTTAEMFRITGVDVKGAHRVTDGEIREIASGFTGENVFRVDIGAAARKASANPWVREVRIERRLPNRISMVFTERLPRVVIQASNGRFLMDGDGVVIVPARETGPLADKLPVIAVHGKRAASGEPFQGDALPAALDLLDELALRGGWDLGDVTVKADSPESIAVLYSGREFRLGIGNYGEKLRRLVEIVTDMNRRGQDYSYIDLRPERQAAVMVVNPGHGARGRGQGPRKRS